MSEKKLNGTVIVTYRCNARCSMCNRYKAPSKPEEEISIETIKKLPKMYFTNITGGEPFIRTDLKEIVRELYKKSDRIVISTNGFFTDRIIDLAKEFPQIGIRISIEGLEQTNNEIRGLNNGFNRGYTTLKKLREMGLKDVGFGMTVQDKNAPDLVPLYELSNKMGMEFATASLHNSFYFVEAKNIIHDRPMVAKNFENLVNELLKSNSPKKWFRAYFNHGLINYIYGQKRLLPCDMSFDTFFIDPYGDVMPCNGTKDKEVMGNLNRQTWDVLVHGRRNRTDHPAITIAMTYLLTHLLSLRRTPKLIPCLLSFLSCSPSLPNPPLTSLSERVGVGGALTHPYPWVPAVPHPRASAMSV